MTDYLTDKVYRFAVAGQLLEEGDEVIAGVSGGADSICLFFILLEITREMGCGFSVVHAHHGIRGAEADEDEAFVRELCRRHGVSLTVYHGDVPALAAARHMSLEEAGRSWRYACLEEAAAGRERAKIALAHHLGDQCETVLMNLLRGTGVRGLAGIPVKRGRIIRPLLCADRGEIEDFLRRQGHSWRTDRTNLETDYTRNRIRLELIPYLKEQINAGADRHITALAAGMREISDYLEAEAAAAAAGIVTEEAGRLRISCEGLLELAPALQKEVLRQTLFRAAGRSRDIGLVHIESLRALFDGQAGSRISLPGGVTAVREYAAIVLGKEDPAGGRPPIRPVEVRIPGTCCGIRFTLLEMDRGEQAAAAIPKNGYTKWFDYDKIKNGLLLRTCREGDYMGIGSGQKKALGRILIDDKIPRAEREGLLLLADGSHVLWIVGDKRSSQEVWVTGSTRRILQAEILAGQKESQYAGGFIHERTYQSDDP